MNNHRETITGTTVQGEMEGGEQGERGGSENRPKPTGAEGGAPGARGSMGTRMGPEGAAALPLPASPSVHPSGSHGTGGKYEIKRHTTHS